MSISLNAGMPSARSLEHQGRQQTASLDGLARLLALQTSWRGRALPSIACALLDTLLEVLRLEFVYLRPWPALAGGPDELMRFAADAESKRAATLSAELREWLPVFREAVALQGIGTFMGPGGSPAAAVPLGVEEDSGVLVAGARRAGFPTEAEQVLLQVAANQAALVFAEARRSGTPEQLLGQRTDAAAVDLVLRREVAERERAEHERQQLASLVENSSDFIGIASLDGHGQFLNAAGRTLVGLDVEVPVRATTMFDYVMPEERAHITQEIIPVVERQGHWEGELGFRHFQTGALIPMLAHVFFVRHPTSGQPVGIATISREIAQRKRQEAELLVLKDELAAELSAMKRLHEFSTRLMSMSDLPSLFSEVLSATVALQNADFGTFQTYDSTTRTIEFVAAFGFEFSGSGKTSLVDAAGACGRAILNKTRVIIEDVMLDQAFAPYWPFAEASGFRAVQATPLISSKGEALGVLTTHFRRVHRPSERDLRLTDLYARHATEMLERMRTRAALRRSEFHLAEAQRISHTGSWVWKLASNEVLWSDEHFRIFGLAPGAIQPSHELFWSIVHGDDRAFIAERFEQAVARHRDFDEQFRLSRADGSVRHIHLLGHPIVNAENELVEYVGTVADVTDRKLAEEAARRAENELARVGRIMTMGELTASIAHEVNQPLAAIVAHSQACLRWLGATPPDVAEASIAAQRIARDAHRASEVISRIRALLTRREQEKTELSVEDIVTDVVSLIRGEARARGVTLEVAIGAELPKFTGDRIQLQQVLLNLSLNAIEAMVMVSGRPRRLDIRVGQHRGELRFEVRDTGPGLQPQHRHRIFDAFYTTKARGMGMGLAISRSIIAAHDGRLWVEPNDGPGETFQFTLPAIVPKARAARRRA